MAFGLSTLNVVRAAACAAFLAGAVEAAFAQSTLPLDDVSINGSVTGSAETYRNFGNKDFSPYFSEGRQLYAELDLNMVTRPSAFETFQARAFALANNSDYRSLDSGLLLENAALRWERGDVELPFRVVAGDYFSFLSSRTIQRSLKGGMFEVQPALGDELTNSTLVFFGAPAADYESIDYDRNLFYGASSLFSWRDLSRVSLNVVGNAARPGSLGGQTRLDERTVSIAGVTEASMFAQTVQFEAEAAAFSGDVVDGGRVRRVHNEPGLFAAVTGSADAAPITYEFRFADYAGDFRPRGNVVDFDRRSYEFYSSIGLPEGLFLRPRLTRVLAQPSQDSELRTDVAGIGLDGIYRFRKGVGLNLDTDFFRQRDTGRGTGVDQTSDVAELNFAFLNPSPWTPSLGLFVQDFRDDMRARNDQTTLEVRPSVRFDRYYAGGYSIYAEPGWVQRRIRGSRNDERDEYGPRLFLGLYTDDGASLDAYALAVFQDQQASGVTEFNFYDAGLYFSYYFGRHGLAIEANYQRQEFDPGDTTTAIRAALRYTLFFNKPRVVSDAPPSGVALSRRDVGSNVGGGYLDFLVAGLGLSVDDLRAQAQRRGLVIPTTFDATTVWSTTAFQQIAEAQRAFAIVRGARVSKLGLVIGFAEDRGFEASRGYETVRSDVARALGAPTFVDDRGRIETTIVDDLRRGDVRRFSAWQTPKGTLRLLLRAHAGNTVRLELIQEGGAVANARRYRGAVEVP